ncbi:uncharacterized protein LY89DRAFT_598580 [Mollisia scopiformis]|uniref:Aerolysin-like C-terminal domain-containing protein n=1 Tax=Mollisia scopiformis TaxID=149040 RepID=A0A132B9W1_MOLSC|nr:uncharacterized protein LY89DRAFT_598580 [Mollisia scopiformis]KUJ09033.1 hypothetical protein LY89DRAFT_598580 [Mollisia scopiformis]
MSASAQTLPPPEVAFRLPGLSSKKVLFSRKSQDPTYWHYPEDGGVYDDQWWYLIPGDGDHAGYYLLKSKYTGKVMFSRKSPDPRVGHIDGDGKYADNWFWLEFGTGDKVNNFRIRNHASDMVHVSRSGTDPEVINYAGDGTKYDDQYFSFLCELVNFDNIEYHINDAKILSSVVVAMGTETDCNETDTDQTIEFTFSKTESVSYTWDYTVGFIIDIGAGVEVEVPFVESGNVRVDVSNTHTFSTMHTTSEDTTFSGTVTTTAPPHTEVTATATMTKSAVSVPFTMYVIVASTNKTVAIEGTYNGTSFWNIQADFTQKSLPDSS